MAPFEYPTDKKTAVIALNFFSNFATNRKFYDVFCHAVYILYGHDYEIKFDFSNRMNFYCKVRLFVVMYNTLKN